MYTNRRSYNTFKFFVIKGSSQSFFSDYAGGVPLVILVNEIFKYKRTIMHHCGTANDLSVHAIRNKYRFRTCSKVRGGKGRGGMWGTCSPR